MADADIHEIAPNLCVIEGHHPQRMWEDPDIPTIAVYRGASTLYLLDTGVGPQQRQAIVDVAGKHGPVDEVLILSSHGHIDHLGNNDVVDDIRAPTRRNYFPRAGRPGLDPKTFFQDMYGRGVPYFDYTDGLDLDADTVSSLVRGVGADDRATPESVAKVGAAFAAAGMVPALSTFLPGLVTDVLMNTYPPVNIRAESIKDYEEIAPAGDIGNTIRTMQRSLELMDSGHVSTICAGHRPMLPQSNDEARATLTGIIAGAKEFTAAVRAGIAKHPDGVCIDELFHDLTADAAPDSIIALLKQLQFPVFATFLKLTLTNECLLQGYRQGRDDRGRITFCPELR